MKPAVSLFLLSLGWLPLSGMAMCYTVYGPSNQIIYRADRTPVDMSGSLSESVRTRFPNGYMVVSLEYVNCTPLGSIPAVSVPVATSAPASKRRKASARP